MHEESRFRDVDYLGSKCLALAQRCVEDPAYFGALAIKDGKAIGIMVGYDAEFFFSTDRAAFDLLWFVLPEHRGSTAGMRLLISFAKWAQGRSLKHVHVGVSTNVNIEKTGSILKRAGFSHVGGSYVMEI
jgi:GNAT superfamily N-acetyltransferase